MHSVTEYFFLQGKKLDFKQSRIMSISLILINLVPQNNWKLFGLTSCSHVRHSVNFPTIWGIAISSSLPHDAGAWSENLTKLYGCHVSWNVLCYFFRNDTATCDSLHMCYRRLIKHPVLYVDSKKRAVKLSQFLYRFLLQKFSASFKRDRW